jgi:4-diphosphocytidyl-2-C-methyl-D-erythritol kinase
MLSFPNCKINLGLHITGKRTDGFHNLETVFYPVAIKDALEIIPSNEDTDIIFSASGKIVNVQDDDNLCVKAYRLLKKDFAQLPNIKMHLHKNIPMGAGLGGGSANASAVLIMLNEIYSLNISTESLIAYALQLGSDCPFFIHNKACFATGRGEVLQPIPIDLSGYKILIVNPGIHVNTGAAFKGLDANNFSPIGALENIVHADINTWKQNLKNDFEKPVFEQNPAIEKIKENLYAQGAVYSAMTGTGSTVFGIFEKSTDLTLNFPAHYFCQLA